MLSKKLTQILLVILFAVLAIVPARAQGTYTPIYTFQGGTDGSGSSGPLWFALVGTLKVPTLWGTTLAGGNGGCYNNLGCGTVFQVNASTNKEKVLWRFQDGPNDGAAPVGGVLRAGGALYGNTGGGGSTGNGAVFKLSGTLETLIGSLPASAVGPSGAMAWNGTTKTLYGTAGFGGLTTGQCSSGCGSVFKVNTITGVENTLHQFAGYPNDGREPWGLIRDAAGNLYGVTSIGGVSLCNGAGCGTIFEISSAGAYSTLHNFSGGTSDGWLPQNGLLLDATSNTLYGSTGSGGTYNKGTVFSYDLATNTYAVIYSFGSGESGTDPIGGLVFDSAGNLWGIAYGGFNNAGIIFELTKSAGTWTTGTVFSFPGGVQGRAGNYGLVYDGTTGNFYGTAAGGAITANCKFGCGVVFKYHQ